jgi:hypothetical protein
MHTLNTLQQAAPAVTAFAVLALPWLTLLAMHAAEAVSRGGLDDKWQARARAAVRWSGTLQLRAV